MAMTIRPTRARLQCLLAGAVAGCATLGAQQAHPSTDTLYSEARSAQQHADLATAIARYRAIIQINPRLVPAWNNLGALFLELHRYQEAVRPLERALALQPHTAAAESLLGSALFAQGELPGAVSILRDALRDNPHDTRANGLLVTALLQQNDESGAVAQLVSWSRHNPADQESLYRLGRLYLTLSQQTLLAAHALDPDSAISHLERGEINESIGDLAAAAAAAADYRDAERIAPERPGVHEHVGNVLCVQGHWAAARDEFEQELKVDPDSCNARWKVANTYLQQRQNLDEALSQLDDTLREGPRLNQARADRGAVLVLLNRANEAVPELKTAEAAEPEEPSIHFWLARAYRLQDNIDLAAAEMETFSQLNATVNHTTAPSPIK